MANVWDDRLPPGGKVFGALAGLGGGIAALCIGIAIGITTLGDAKRQYPEIIMGLLALSVIGAAVASSRADNKAAAPPPKPKAEEVKKDEPKKDDAKK